MDQQKLESLADMVDQADAIGGPTPEQQAEQEAASAAEVQAREWGVMLYTIGGALSVLAPELRKVYTQEACLAWGNTVVPVAEKYGWSSVSRFPEFALAMSTLGMVVPTIFIIKKRLAEAKEGKGGDDDGVLGGIRAWWRSKRAEKAAQAGQRVASEVVMGAGHGIGP